MLGYRTRADLVQTMTRREFLYWKAYRALRYKLKEEAAKNKKQLLNWWD